ncbi:uncharacterized protein LOC131938154 [Physella acuta]|uniref:uncharacterized protein LOC131938154 n=1 Tax=Physella acuta TaxID=109671 RepID=UPI0027DC2F6F|nr:uncharacterized protein LOC131938154 [Physella acuta]
MTDSKVLLFVGRSGNGITSTIDAMFKGLNARGSRAGVDNGDGDGTGNQAAGATGGQGEDVMEDQGVELTKDLVEEVVKVQEKDDAKGLGEVVVEVQKNEDAEDLGEGAKGQVDESAIVRKLCASEKSGFQIRTNGSVTAVDGYGLAEPKADQVVLNTLLEARIKQMNEDTSGFVALIFVLKYGVRFTKQEHDSVAIVKKRFGETIFRQRGIIVLTHGDNFEVDNDENNPDAFKKWYESQSGAFCDLLQDCEKRIVLFNNKTSNLAQQQQQSDELLRHVETVQQKNKSELQTSVDISDEEDTDDNTSLLGERTQRTHIRKCTNYDYYFWIFYPVLVAVCVIIELLVLRLYNII